MKNREQQPASISRRIKSSRYRYLIPNLITSASLACGISAILAAATGSLTVAGLLILASYILDLFDGELARQFEASSEFGLHLDSLVDVISLGCAPTVLAFFHLQAVLAGNPAWRAMLWSLSILYVLAGAFRLARFNLLPVKEGQTDSVGLTISTAGATLTLAVLSDLANTAELVPDPLFLLLMVILALLMVSRIPHPSIVWIFSRRWANLFYMVYLAVTLFLLQLPFFNVWFLFNGGYLGAALVRAGFHSVQENGG